MAWVRLRCARLATISPISLLDGRGAKREIPRSQSQSVVREWVEIAVGSATRSLDDSSHSATATAGSGPLCLLKPDAYADPAFAEQSQASRPRPPLALLDLLCQGALAERPHLVVALGFDAGLSTAIWSGRADAAIGLDKVERADVRFPVTTRRLLQEHALVGRSGKQRCWPKEGRRDWLRSSGHVVFVREVLLHAVEPGTADRVVRWAVEVLAAPGGTLQALTPPASPMGNSVRLSGKI